MSGGVAASERALTGPVIGITLITFVFMTAYLFFFPTLPFFIEELGGDKSEIGLLIGVSSLAALLFRPFVGYGLDAFGRRPLLIGGFLVFALTAALYHLPQSTGWLFPIRIMNGLSLAIVITTASTYVADVAPINRRGAVISYFGVATSLSFVVGPALGGYIINSGALRDFDGFFTGSASWLSGAQTGDYNFTTLFLAASATGLVLAAVGLLLPEPDRPRVQPKIEVTTLVSREAVFPASVNLLGSFTFAAMVTFMPLFVRQEGLDNPGALFIVYGGGVILVRIAIGNFIDSLPRGAIIIPGFAFVAASMALFGVATTVPMFFLASLLYGMGAGAFQPALMTFLVDRAPPEERGRAMGTFTLGSDLGLSSGAVALGFVAEATGFRVGFGVASLVAVGALLLFVAGQARALRAETQRAVA
jgi:MFS family permease